MHYRQNFGYFLLMIHNLWLQKNQLQLEKTLLVLFKTPTSVLSNLFEVLETYFSRRLIKIWKTILLKKKKKKIESAIIISEIFTPDIPFFQTSINKFMNSSVLFIFKLIYFYQFLSGLKIFVFSNLLILKNLQFFYLYT